MNFRRRTTHPTERDLAGLADGTLSPARRAQVGQAVAVSPELQADIAAQKRVLSAIHNVASERAPEALRARVAAAGQTGRRPKDGRAATVRRRPLAVRPRAVTAVTATALGAVVAAVAVLAGGGAGGATVAQASVIATRPAQVAPPAPGAESVALPRLRAAGLPYPYWEDAFGYRATGVRYDRLDGHSATTVFYARGGARVAYTILDGALLPTGAPARSTVRDGVVLRSLSADGRTVVTWVRAGHTCVLTGQGASSGTLLRLASWRHGGQVRY